jgi:hypothetical protein
MLLASLSFPSYNRLVEKDQGRHSVSPAPSLWEAPYRLLLANPRQATGVTASAAWRVVAFPTCVELPCRLASTDEEEYNVPSIIANTSVVTQINIFTVPVGGQQPLIELLMEAAKYASATPGWLSASVHRSRDGTSVVNYAQSESMEAALRVIDRLRAGGWLERNKAFGEAHPGLYDVVFTLEK